VIAWKQILLELQATLLANEAARQPEAMPL
jgi:hypothetical protein